MVNWFWEKFKNIKIGLKNAQIWVKLEFFFFMKIRNGHQGLVWKGRVYEKKGQKRTTYLRIWAKICKFKNILKKGRWLCAIITHNKLLKLPGHFLTTLSCLPSGTVSENDNEQIYRKVLKYWFRAHEFPHLPYFGKINFLKEWACQFYGFIESWLHAKYQKTDEQTDRAEFKGSSNKGSKTPKRR